MKSVDVASAEAIRDRAGFHNRLREECPVALSPGGEFHIVAGFDNVRTVLEDHAVFTKAWGSQLAPMEHQIALNQDPPDFSDMKRIYNAYMSPAGVKRWAVDCARIANEVIDAFIDQGSGDLQQLFGKPVPARVTALALGFPEDEVDRYRAWTDAFLDAMIRSPEEQLRVINEMYAFFDVQFEARRRKLREAGIVEPGPEHIGPVLDDSLTSVLMTTPYRGRYLDNDELRRTVRGFFVGGVDTTGALMLHTLDLLLERPALWEQVQNDPRLLEPAIEEALRFRSPAMGMFRQTTCPAAMEGTTIPGGTRVLFSILSANRDPKVFPNPDDYRLDRGPVRHIAFGAGAHFCPGAWTARLEARIALEILIARLPNLRLVREPTYFDAANFWIVRSFPAAWD